MVGGAILLTVSGCGDSTREGHDDKIELKNYCATRSYRVCDHTDPNDIQEAYVFDSVSMVLPVKLDTIDVTPIIDTISYYAFDRRSGSTFDETVESWFTDYTEQLASQAATTVTRVNTDQYDVASNFRIITGHVVNVTPNLFVYCVKSNVCEYPTDAPMIWRHYINCLYSSGGKILTYSDLFTPEGIKELPKVIAQRAAEMAPQIGNTNVTELPADNNFFISSEDEIVFSYQIYEISSSQDPINISFYPYELVDYMTEQAIDMFALRDLHD
jgi:hypothetical protein